MEKANRDEVDSNHQHSSNWIVAIRVKKQRVHTTPLRAAPV
jgi:hypothetical protein